MDGDRPPTTLTQRFCVHVLSFTDRENLIYLAPEGTEPRTVYFTRWRYVCQKCGAAFFRDYPTAAVEAEAPRYGELVAL